MPCKYIIYLLIDHLDIKHRLTKYDQGNTIVSFQPSSLEIYYMLAKPKVNMTYEWVAQFTMDKNYHELHNPLKISMASFIVICSKKWQYFDWSAILSTTMRDAI
jgi:hypothetical protein